MAHYNGRNSVKLDQLCRVLGVSGKVEGMEGAKVADLAAAVDFAAIGRYCLGDVAATLRLFLLRERFHNRLSEAGLEASLDNLELVFRAGGLPASPTA